MHIQQYPHHIFWNYQPAANLPESIVAEQVLQYGDVEDIALLFKQVSRPMLATTLSKMKQGGRWTKRINFIEKVFLNR